jgi:hypothetical protein
MLLVLSSQANAQTCRTGLPFARRSRVQVTGEAAWLRASNLRNAGFQTLGAAVGGAKYYARVSGGPVTFADFGIEGRQVSFAFGELYDFLDRWKIAFCPEAIFIVERYDVLAPGEPPGRSNAKTLQVGARLASDRLTGKLPLIVFVGGGLYRMFESSEIDNGRFGTITIKSHTRGVFVELGTGAKLGTRLGVHTSLRWPVGLESGARTALVGLTVGVW